MIVDAFVAGVLGLLIFAIVGFGPILFGNWQAGGDNAQTTQAGAA